MTWLVLISMALMLGGGETVVVVRGEVEDKVATVGVEKSKMLVPLRKRMLMDSHEEVVLTYTRTSLFQVCFACLVL
jgi:hypothetical protein